MPRSGRPNQVNRLISHAVVGLAVGMLVGSKKGKSGFVMGAIASVAAHEMLDAPVADLVAEFTP
jgi:hypothetical protein